MKLTKIYSNDCDVCNAIADSAKALADDCGFEYDSIDLKTLAHFQSPLRDYVIHYYVTPNDGMIDLPIFTISTDQGSIQGSSVVRDLEEVANLIQAWKKWESSQKP